MEDKELMEAKDSEPIDTQKQEKSEQLESVEDKDLNLDSVIDVSGKVLDFPLIDSEESSVEKVYVYKNELNLIPRAVGRFKGLKTLKFFANELNFFPGELRNLVDLECLQVKVAAPGVSGLELSKLKNLTELELSRGPARQSAFPILSEIVMIKRLTKLTVCHFSIRYLPPEIGCLSNLEYLDLSFNKMRNLPDEITSLNLLISLKVSNNKLIELPRLSRLQRLENLDLSNNRLTSLGSLELESMHNLQTFNLQHNQLRGCRVPSWICCNMDGNGTDVSSDDSTEMEDAYEGVIQEIHNNPCNKQASSPPPTKNQKASMGSSVASELLPNRQCLSTTREKGWKRRYNLQTKARNEQLTNFKKWKVDATAESSSEKCMICRLSENRDNSLSEYSSVADVDLDNKDIIPDDEVQGNSSISSRNENSTEPKEAADRCLCSANESDMIQERAEADGSQSSAVLSSISDAVEVLDEGSLVEKPNCVPKPKRHSDKDLDNPKPTKTRRPTSDPSHISCQYSEKSFCGVGDYLPDGFYDAGRDRPFMPLGSYEKNLHINSREVLLLDRERDEALDAVLLCARALVNQFKQVNSSINKHTDVRIDDLHMASLLALFVSDHFGGSDKRAVVQRARKSVSGSNFKKPFVCTCATGISGSSDNKAMKQGVDSLDDPVFLDICDSSLRSIKERHDSGIVPIGALQFGVCRHRALLMKYLCDRLEPPIPCELVRGYLEFAPHAWNVIIIKRGKSLVRLIVDACRPHDIREESDPEYSCRYIPLSRMSAPIGASCDASPNGSFPSLSGCNKLGKLASTSLLQCNVGSLEGAVKVRTLEVNGASADEVRNFELCCLGEVRMLSVLKHSCIVEFYGHQISSKWSLTADGDAEGRILQSAIFMEYVKGGSLKSYVDKLSDSGGKYVSPDLALSIARDVAFALTEVHSKDIIHRDIKSENILIDLEKKKQDGTPTVKICDFDRAIPLNSYQHTCCIAHLGIPPPDICVGTPRWMAPEVFRAMHKSNMYGLEVDIWSFGCLLLELLTLQVPYSGLPESKIHNFLENGERPRLTEELEELASSEGELDTESETLKFLTKLYHQCTEKNPDDRPSAEKIYSMLVAHSSSAIVSRSSEQEIPIE